jgi:hypothetical protein
LPWRSVKYEEVYLRAYDSVSQRARLDRINPVHSPPLSGETDVSIVLQTMADPKMPATEGVSGHFFFFDGLRLALLRPSYRVGGRRRTRFCSYACPWLALTPFSRSNDVGHRRFRLGRDHQTIIRTFDHETASHVQVSEMTSVNYLITTELISDYAADRLDPRICGSLRRPSIGMKQSRPRVGSIRE